MLQLKNLTIAAPDGRRLLTQTDYVFRPGVTALIGANGVGKSTLLRAIATVHPLVSGNILIGQLDSQQQRARYLEQMMFLPQTFSAYPELTGREFLEYFLRLRGAGRKDAMHVSSAWLQQVNLQWAGGARTGTYSQGMLQRLGIAYALQVDAQAYVLDEPFAGVDPENREALIDLLFVVGSSKVVLITTHEIEDMVRVGARIVRVNGETLKQ